MNISRGPGLPSADSMAGRVSGLHEDTLTGKLHQWTGSAWVWMRPVPEANGSAGSFLAHDNTWASMVGSAFPTTGLYDGRPFIRSDLSGLYTYRSSISKWLSDAVHEITGGDNATVNASTYLRMAINGTEQRYSALRGWVFGFDVVCVGMTIFAGGSSTATLEVHDDGSAVTGASVSLSAQTGPVTSESLLSSVIASGSVVSLYCNATGAMNTVAIARARFRRCAT